jgi:hypothetical protein
VLEELLQSAQMHNSFNTAVAATADYLVSMFEQDRWHHILWFNTVLALFCLVHNE